MTRCRLSILAVVLAALCLLLGLYDASTASAGSVKVQLSVGGRAFTSSPRGPLMDTAPLAPGQGAGAAFGVRSGFGAATDLVLTMVEVQDDDNGCVAPEAALDTGCGAGQGELGGVLQAVVASAPTPDGTYTPVWNGSASDLVAGADMHIHLRARGDRWIRLSLSVPTTVGNVIETDTFRFGLRVVLQGDGGAGVDAAVIHRGDGEPVDTNGTGGLAATGVPTVLFTAGGVLLVVAGAVLLLSGRDHRRRATASDGSWTARRGSRRAAAP